MQNEYDIYADDGMTSQLPAQPVPPRQLVVSLVLVLVSPSLQQVY